MPPYNPGPLFRRGNRTFGRQRHPITGRVTGHAGDDWPAQSGTPIPAAYGGRVIENRYQYNAATGTGWGWMVLLEHQVNGQTVQTRYAHMRQQSPLGVGEPVFKGQTIGEVGSTGGSTGPHLHFEVIVNGEHVDPATFDFPDEATETTGNWSYPFSAKDPNGDTPVSETYQHALAEAESGYFPVGISGIWHGGIHFDRGTGTRLEQEDGVHSITSGEVIAYRVDSTYPMSEYSAGEAEYSRGFALVRHSLTLPPPPKSRSTSETPDGDRAATDDDSADSPPRPRPRPVDAGTSGETSTAEDGAGGEKEGNEPDDETLTFFSLYMHLAQAGDYSEGEKTSPGYWESHDNRYRVAGKAIDANPYDPADRRKGIRIRQGRGSSTACIGWLAPGVTLTVEAGSGNWRKIVAYNEGGPAVDPEHSPPQDAPLGWIYIGELNKVDVRDPAATDTVHVLETPVPVQAGEFLGYLGQYRRRRDAGPFCTPRPMVHLEVFAGDEFESFIAKSRERAAELPQAIRTLLHIKKDARLALPTEPDRPVLPAEAVVADESDSDAGEWVHASIGIVQTLPRSALGTYSGDTTRSYGGVHHLLRILDTSGNAIALGDYNVLGRTAQATYPNREVVSATDTKVWIRRSDLGEGRVMHGRTLPAWSAFPLDPAANNGPTSAFPRVIPVASLPTPVTDGDGKRWWQVEVGTEGGDSATGWARESDQPNVELCSPWAWPGFDITLEQTTRADMHQHSLHVNRETHAGENFKVIADQVDGSQLFKKLREALDVDGSNGISRTEMRRGLRRPWLAQAISHLIIRYESEWGGGMSKWAELDPQMEGELAADWEVEKARIEDLQWWDDVAGTADLPGSPELYFIHPIALINNFFGTGSDTDLDDLIRRIGDIIAHGEGNYESYNSGTKGVQGGRVGHSFVNPPAGTVTGKTINQILATDSLSGTDSNRMFATGKYQTVISTLTAAKNAMGLTGNELYDANLQERVFAEYLLEKAGGGALARFVKDGIGTIEDAQYAAAKEWASIAAPAGRTIRDGRTSDGNMSYYESAANRANSVSTRDLRTILQEIQQSR